MQEADVLRGATGTAVTRGFHIQLEGATGATEHETAGREGPAGDSGGMGLGAAGLGPF